MYIITTTPTNNKEIHNTTILGYTNDVNIAKSFVRKSNISNYGFTEYNYKEIDEISEEVGKGEMNEVLVNYEVKLNNSAGLYHIIDRISVYVKGISPLSIKGTEYKFNYPGFNFNKGEDSNFFITMIEVIPKKLYSTREITEYLQDRCEDFIMDILEKNLFKEISEFVEEKTTPDNLDMINLYRDY